MDKELLKLSKLCEHWAEHNESHKESITKWRDIAKTRNLNSIVEKLNKAMQMIDNCNQYLLQVAQEITQR